MNWFNLYYRFQICPDLDQDVNLCYISMTLPSALQFVYIQLPSQMLSTIIAPCLSPYPQLHPPPPPPLPLPQLHPPLATYTLRVRSTQLDTLKHSSTFWNWTSQEKSSVCNSYNVFILFKISLTFFRICC